MDNKVNKVVEEITELRDNTELMIAENDCLANEVREQYVELYNSCLDIIRKYLTEEEIIKGKCSDCNWWCKDRAIDSGCYCSSFHTYTGCDFYCAEFEHR